jgi:hypothetical protein
MQAQELAIYKSHLPKSGLIQFSCAEQTTLKLAINKGKKRQVDPYKTAIFENTVAIFPCLEALFGKVLILEFLFFEVAFGHVAVLGRRYDRLLAKTRKAATSAAFCSFGFILWAEVKN